MGLSTRAQTWSDGSFVGWQSQLYVTTPACTGTWSVMSANGNPGAYIQTVLHPESTSTVTGSAGLTFSHPSFVWDPALDGPIASVQMTLDLKLVSTTGQGTQGQGVATIALQSGQRFTAGYSLTGLSTNWHARNTGLLRASDHVASPGNGTIDFGVSGAPITFGFAVSDSTPWRYPSNGYQFTARAGYDHWPITIVPRGPFSTFGYGCPGGNGLTPTMGNDNFPGLGFQHFRMNLSRAPATSAMLILGLQQQPTPVPGALVGAPGCDLLVDAVALSGPIGISAAGTANATVPIPNRSTLVGTTVHGQWVAFDATATTIAAARPHPFPAAASTAPRRSLRGSTPRTQP